MKKQILIFSDYYLPGYKGGGGMRSMVNLVERFRDRYDFRVVTRNHDGRNDRRPYSEVITGEWNSVAGADVFYLAPRQITPRFIRNLIASSDADLLLLNSVFSTLAIIVLLARRFGLQPNVPVILAPCGELMPPALALKPFKKKLYLAAASWFGLYAGVIWKASHSSESDEIGRFAGPNAKIFIAPDQLPKQSAPDLPVSHKPKKQEGSLKCIFYSRIVKKKNLDYFLRVLENIRDGKITLDIVGPVEEKQYWADCRKLINRLPSNITVNITGAVSYQSGLNKLYEAHIFVLPTLSENFGYVVIEAMSAGCVLLISDRTPWNMIEEEGIGSSIPLEDPSRWESAVKSLIKMGDDEFRSISENAAFFANHLLNDPAIENATKILLEIALHGRVKD